MNTVNKVPNSKIAVGMKFVATKTNREYNEGTAFEVVGFSTHGLPIATTEKQITQGKFNIA